MVIMGVRVNMGVNVGSGVGGRVAWHGGWLKVISSPLVSPPASHSYSVYRFWAVGPCTPTVALVPVCATAPYTMSNRLCPSYNRTSKLAVEPVALKYTARHSMLKMRLGALPDSDVNMPHPPGNALHPVSAAIVSWSSQCAKIV